jgi:LCP family protein required for cell wall assembly
MTSIPSQGDSGRHRHARGTGLGRRYRRVALICTRSLAALVSLALLFATGYYDYTYRSLESGLQHVDLPAAGKAPPVPVEQDKQAHIDGKTQNILVVGVDSRAGLSAAQEKELEVGHDQTTSTDTIMVIHVPGDGSRATLISIPRDSYVDIPGGWAKNKINAAYADASGGSDTPAARKAGENLLMKTVSKLTGLILDHYIQVGFRGFEMIAKAIGGIDVDLCDAVDDTRAYNLAHGETGWSGFKMSAGHHHLNAVQALKFVRQRHNLPGIGDDLGREQRQRYFLAQAFRQILTAGTLTNPAELNRLVSAVKGALTVDKGLTLRALADQMIDLNSQDIVGQTIPTTGTANVYIAHDSYPSSVLTVNPAEVRAWIQRQLYPAAGGGSATTGSPTTGSPTTGSASGSSSEPAAGTSALSNPASGCIH